MHTLISIAMILHVDHRQVTLPFHTNLPQEIAQHFPQPVVGVK